MRIAFLLNMKLDSMNSGPSVHLMCSLIHACAESGDDVCVVSHASVFGDGPLIAEIKRSHRITHERVSVPEEDKANLVKRYLDEARYFSRASRRIRFLGSFDAVFIQSCTNPYVAVRCARGACPRARIVYNVQDVYPEAALCRGIVTRRSVPYLVAERLQSAAYAKSDGVVTVSEDMGKVIEASGVASGKVAIIHNWAYSDELVKVPRGENPFFQEQGFDSGKFYAVYAGNVGTLQNVEVIVETARLLAGRDDIRFLIVGGGTDAARIDGMIESFGLRNVIRLGRQPSDVAPYVYAMAGLNFITLKRGVTRAALPSKTAICLSCGRPIVLAADEESEYARAMGSLPNCIAVPPDDAEAMKRAVLDIVDAGAQLDPEPARRLFSSEFSRSKNVSRYLDVLHGIGMTAE